MPDMNGRTHTLSGVTVALATLPIAPVGGLNAQAAWVTVVSGASLLPDLDHPGSTLARAWGALSWMPSRLIAAVSLGHRKGTHDLLVAPIIFGLLAWAASSARWSTWLLFAVTVGLAISAADLLALPGKVARLVNVTLSFSVAGILLAAQTVPPSWLPVAVAVGTLAHIVGDACTDRGVPVPLMWLRPLFGKSMRRVDWWGPRLWKSGGRLERWAVAPCLVVVAGIAGWAVTR